MRLNYFLVFSLGLLLFTSSQAQTSCEGDLLVGWVDRHPYQLSLNSENQWRGWSGGHYLFLRVRPNSFSGNTDSGPFLLTVKTKSNHQVSISGFYGRPYLSLRIKQKQNEQTYSILGWLDRLRVSLHFAKDSPHKTHVFGLLGQSSVSLVIEEDIKSQNRWIEGWIGQMAVHLQVSSCVDQTQFGSWSPGIKNSELAFVLGLLAN